MPEIKPCFHPKHVRMTLKGGELYCRQCEKMLYPEDIDPVRDALREVLDSLGALGESYYELVGHGFTLERALEITELVGR